MKKALLIALTLIPVLFACKKNNDAVVQMEPAKNARNAAKVDVSANPISVKLPGDRSVSIEKIDFLRSGRYVAEARESVPNPTSMSTKGSTGVIILTGKYTYTDGKYKTTGELTVTVELNETAKTVTVTDTQGAKTVPAEIDEGSEPEDLTPQENNVYRTWKINHVILSGFAKLGSTSARATSVTALVNVLKEKGIAFKAEDEAKIVAHDIKEISLDEGVICISFTNADAFKGTFNLENVSSISSFSYKMQTTSGGDQLISAEANGTVEFSGNQAIINLELKTNMQELGNGNAKIVLDAVSD